MDDLISRQAAIDAMLRLQAEDDEAYGCHIPEGFDGERAKEVLEQLPSAEPERKKGKWIEKKVSEETCIEEWQVAKCSVCGKYHTTPYLYYFDEYNFCPCCGADMRGEEYERL